MKVYLLWFNEWEANDLIGIFETESEAKRWKDYFLANPSDEYSMDIYDDLDERLEVQVREVGTLDSYLKIDNLKFLEFHEGKANEQKTKESSEVGEKLGFIRS